MPSAFQGKAQKGRERGKEEMSVKEYEGWVWQSHKDMPSGREIFTGEFFSFLLPSFAAQGWPLVRPLKVAGEFFSGNRF